MSFLSKCIVITNVLDNQKRLRTTDHNTQIKLYFLQINKTTYL
jgi:hypothetical protein